MYSRIYLNIFKDKISLVRFHVRYLIYTKAVNIVSRKSMVKKVKGKLKKLIIK